MKNVHLNPKEYSVTTMGEYPVGLIYHKANDEGYQCMYPGCYAEEKHHRDIVNHIEQYHPKDKILCKRCGNRTRLEGEELCDKCSDPYRECVVCGKRFRYKTRQHRACSQRCNGKVSTLIEKGELDSFDLKKNTGRCRMPECIKKAEIYFGSVNTGFCSKRCAHNWMDLHLREVKQDG